MKNIDYYLKLPYRLEIIPDIYEGGYVASYPELPGCPICTNHIVVSTQTECLQVWDCGSNKHQKQIGYETNYYTYHAPYATDRHGARDTNKTAL